jgi:hypothetical protein
MNQVLQNWRKGVVPHEDIRENRVNETLFAVNLSRAIHNKGASEYREPKLFFERTYLTRTLQSLILDVVNILRGQPATNSVLHLQTNFGGGKSHAELALYHLLTSPQQCLTVPHLADFLSKNGIIEIPSASLAALPCADLNAQGRQAEDGLKIYTLWGEVAYRLGGALLYNTIRENDLQRTSPGVEDLRNLLIQAGPNLILIDELLHYVDKAAAIQVGDSNLASQTVAFLRELSEAVDQVDHSVLVASLTASDMEGIQVLTQEQAMFTLTQLENILRRLEDVRTPIESSEIYEIARLRLFEQVSGDLAVQAAQFYSQMYRSDSWREVLPAKSRDTAYENLLERAYPFHPSIIDVLYERWGSRPQFQLTRGTLRFLSHLLAHLWQPASTHLAQGPLVHLSDIDLSDDDLRGETLKVAGSVWEAVIGTDIATWEGSESIWEGKESISQKIDHERGGLYQRYKLTQGIATSVLMFTHGGTMTRPTPEPDIRLAVIQPEIPLPDLHQAMDDCAQRLYFYYKEEGGLIFKTEPNPNKVLADERSNVETDEARRKVEGIIEDALGKSELFNVCAYGFQNSRTKEPGDVPDEGKLQVVVLPPSQTLFQGKLDGRLTNFLSNISENYGVRHRMNRNMVLFMVPDAGNINLAVSHTMDWIAAENVLADSGLMARFSEGQQEYIRDKRNTARNDARDFVRKAYRAVILPNGEASKYDVLDLTYIPPNKTVLQQAQEDLISNGRVHQEFNPALLDGRWETLWPKTATVITTQTLWEKFSRRSDAPILTGIDVLRNMIKKGVERNLFGLGILVDTNEDMLKRGSYEHKRIYFGSFDATEIGMFDISHRTVLMRAEQVNAIFKPITQEEVAMLVTSPRNPVQAVFQAARSSQMITGRTDPASFFNAIVEGVKAGLFGYTTSTNATIQRGAGAELTASEVNFSGYLIGEDVPLPVSADEVAVLIPEDGLISVQEIFQKALLTYGSERVSEQSLLNALQRCIKEQRFGATEEMSGVVQYNLQALALTGFIGKPKNLPPNVRHVRLAGVVSAIDLASVIKTTNALSKLGEAIITIDLRLELKGEISDHSVNMSLTELRQRVTGLKIEDAKGGN